MSAQKFGLQNSMILSIFRISNNKHIPVRPQFGPKI